MTSDKKAKSRKKFPNGCFYCIYTNWRNFIPSKSHIVIRKQVLDVTGMLLFALFFQHKRNYFFLSYMSLTVIFILEIVYICILIEMFKNKTYEVNDINCY